VRNSIHSWQTGAADRTVTHVADVLGQLDGVGVQPLPDSLVEPICRRDLDHLPPSNMIR